MSNIALSPVANNKPSPVADNKFIRGKEDWLFIDNDSNQVNAQISGKKALSLKKLRQWHLLLEMRNAWLKTKGVSYFFLVAPSKGCIYPEFLPPSVSISHERCINQIRQYLLERSSPIMPIYPIEELKLAKQKEAVYSMRDSHWNRYGAFVAYQALASQIAAKHKIRVLEESDVVFERYQISYSDLGAKIGIPEDSSISARVIKKFSKAVFHNKVRTRGKILIFENKKYKYLPTAVIFRDSFSNMMLGFLSESFSRLVAVWQPNIDYSIVLDENPDIVMSQQAERFIPRIPNDLKGDSNAEIVAAKATLT